MLKKMPLSYLQFMKRISTFFLIVVAATSLTICIAFLTEIKVRGDGSGTMVQTITMNPEQMKESMESIAKQMGATTTESTMDLKKDPPNASREGLFKEDDLNAHAAAKVATALYRLEQGNLSNVKAVGKGMSEYRLDFGPGYRIYFGQEGTKTVVLLGGGSKKTQGKDIRTAQALWAEYKSEKVKKK